MALIVYVTAGIPQLAAQITTFVAGQHAVRTVATLQPRNLALLLHQMTRLGPGQAAVADALANLRLLLMLAAINAVSALAMAGITEPALMSPVAPAMPALAAVVIARMLDVPPVPVQVAMHFATLAP